MAHSGLLNEEHIMIRDIAREFTLNEVLPVANKLDPEQGDIPIDLRKKLADMRYIGNRIHVLYGGSGLGCVEYCVNTEELS